MCYAINDRKLHLPFARLESVRVEVSVFDECEYVLDRRSSVRIRR